MITVTYKDSQPTVVSVAEPDATLLDISLQAGLAHFHQCRGNARCTTCRVRVLEGHGQLSPPTSQEIQIAERHGWGPETRLACQARVGGDITAARMVLDTALAETVYTPSPTRPAEEKSVAVLFFDLRKFTPFAKQQLPHDVVYVLNRIFREVCEPVLVHHGYIDKYLGDGFLAVFGLHERDSRTVCEQAVRAALDIESRFDAINAWLEKTFSCHLNYGIGIHFGPVVVGQTGHPQHMQLTVLGDTVNVAHRIEGLTKQLNARLLVSDAVAGLLGSALVAHQSFRCDIPGVGSHQALHEPGHLALDREALAVREQFARIAGNADEFAQRFYGHLFALDPQIAPLFAQTDMAFMRTKLIDALAQGIARADTLPPHDPALAELGAFHTARGVSLRHFELARHALIRSLAETLGDDFGPASARAWRIVFDALVARMLPRAEKQR